MEIPNNNLPVALRPYAVNQRAQFKELIVGAGANVFKANSEGVFAGAVKYTTAPFRLSYAGALVATSATITGAITATSGEIQGNLTVSGSLLSDDGSAYQTKLLLGKISFLKSGTEKAFIKTATDSASLQIATGSYFYVTKSDGNPLLRVDQSGNMEFSTDSYIKWSSGRKITADAANMTADGGWLVLGSVRATKYVYRSGVTDYDGLDDLDVYVASTSGGSPTKQIRIRGGIATVS